MSVQFELGGPLLDGVFAIEASAGTGKTYSLTGLVARHVAERGLRPDQLLMVTFTRASTADMRDRTRVACRHLLRVLETAPEVRSSLSVDPWMLDVLDDVEEENVRRRANLRAFLAAYDEATITTIHGFCQLVLNRAGLASPALGDVTLVGDASDTVAQVVSDVLIGPFSEHPDLFGDSPTGTNRSMNTAVSDLKKIVKAVMGNPSTVHIPDISPEDLRAELVQLDPEHRWAVIVERIISTVQDRRRAARVFGYDDLIHSVTDMLVSERSDRIIRSLRDQFRLVMIDEFQDTDIAQWTIFERAFVRPLGGPDDGGVSSVAVGVVGDPKQAIYRFRGADIDAYRSAIDSISNKVELITNFRSNARLIEAVNTLFAGVTFGDSSISYRQVAARSGPDDEGIVGHLPLEIRHLPYCEEAGSHLMASNLNKSDQIAFENGTFDKWAINSDVAMELIYTDMVKSISELIESGEIIDKSGKKRTIRPGDIAVLVRSHSHAERIRDIFSAAKIPAVRYRARSVFESPAAFEWRIFLAALAAPSRIDRVRACALSVFGRSDIGSMLSRRGVEVEMWQRTIAEWSQDVLQVGLSTVYFRLRSDPMFMTRVMGEMDGERLLTDLDHIAEILAGMPDLELGGGAADCLQILERLASEAGDDDEFQRRIETDAEAVHIATIHHSKGLEFPVVFLPTLMKMHAGSETPFVFSSEGRRVIDLATPVEWTWEDSDFPNRDDRKEAASADITSDLMRMLYVAVTRAEQKVVLYWTPVKSAGDSSLGRLFFAPWTEYGPEIDPHSGVPSKATLTKSKVEMLSILEKIAGRSPQIQVGEVDRKGVVSAVEIATTRSTTNVEVASFTRTAPVRRSSWGKWSYSGVANALGTVHSAMAEPFVPGADEGRGTSLDTPGTAPDTGTILFPDDLYGAAFGSRIHKIFEAIDPSAGDLLTEVRRAVARQFEGQIETSVFERLIRAIETVHRTPLGPIFEGRDLASIDRRDRLVEMIFDMRIPNTAIPVSTIGRLLTEHLDGSHPFAAYGAQLMQRAERLRMAGFLYGEVDAVFRLHRADGSWTTIISDYKTNLLHRRGTDDPLASYRHDELVHVMADDHYVLQALLYQVALHRYLRWRVSEYRPDVHLGGIAYLFVRGLIGPDTPVGATGDPCGVFTWQPPQSLIEALDEELTR